MMGPPSSRSVDVRLAAASGVMRDTVGAIHNLQHLLASVKVGPKALARVIPDVHASCQPMIAAVGDLVAGAALRLPGVKSAVPLGGLLKRRMEQLEAALAEAQGGQFRASDRLHLETAIAEAVRDLDGALELVELMVEASASGNVPVDVTDVIRESGARPDTGSGRGRRVRLTFGMPAEPVVVRVNPRLALRLVAFAAALSDGGEQGVGVTLSIRDASVELRLGPPAASDGGMQVAVPPLIDLSEQCLVEVAVAAGTTLETGREGHATTLTFPLAGSD
jgi:hypothetical protein